MRPTLKVIQPADIRLRRARRYQRLRLLTLAISCLFTFGLPLWHLAAIESASAGVAGGGRWAAVGGALFPKTAPPLVGAPSSVDFFGLEFVDPLEAISVLLASGPSLALLWAAWPAALLVAVFGRFFCGWLCPYIPVLSASNAARALLHRVRLTPKDIALPRRTSIAVMIAMLAATAFAGSQIVPLFYPPAVIGREAFRAIFFGGLGLGGILIGAAFLFDTLVARAGTCRYLCPGGAGFQVLGAYSPIKVIRSAPACTDCTVCDVVCNLLQQPMSDKVDAGCERCGRCVSACPTGALEIGFVGRKKE